MVPSLCAARLMKVAEMQPTLAGLLSIARRKTQWSERPSLPHRLPLSVP
jgi:hypothetical protein